MNTAPSTSNGGRKRRRKNSPHRNCHIVTIWRDDVFEPQFNIDPPLSLTEATAKLTNYLNVDQKLVWVHLYGNNPTGFESLLNLTRSRNHMRLQHKFLDLLYYTPDPQAVDLENRHHGKAVLKSGFFNDRDGPGTVVIMPVAQYPCLDQSQGAGAAAQAVDIVSLLREGKFRDLPKLDQIWAVQGNGLVLTSSPCPMRDDVFLHLLDDIRTGVLFGRTLPPTSPGLFSLVLRRCIRNQSDFLKASNTIVGEVSTARADAFNDLRNQLENLPEPKEPAYDNELRDIIDNLIRIQREIRWLNVLSTLSRNIAIFLDTCLEQHNTSESLMTAVRKQNQVEGWDWEEYGTLIENWERALQSHLGELNRMQHHLIPNVEDQIKELFKFKQSLSNVLSSQFQLRQADASTRSGNIIMYFTMMTILFSSLSFMAAFFALNIRSFPRNDQGDVELSMSYVTSRIVAWSIAIAAPFWLLAAFLNPMAELLDWLLPGWLSPKKGSRSTGNP